MSCWLGTEIKVVREVYPHHGAKACARKVPHSPEAIRHLAKRIGVVRLTKGGKPYRVANA